MTKNFETFQEFNNSLNVNFTRICLSETSASDNNLGKNSLFQPERYNPIHKIRKNPKGSGVAIFIRDSLLHKIQEELSMNCDDIESYLIQIISDRSKNNILNLVYRSPKYENMEI